MANTWTLTVTTTESVGQDATDISTRPGQVLTNWVNFLAGLAQGAKFGTVDLQKNGGNAAAATGTLTISSGSGTVGGSIGGTAVTVTWGTSDTASATALKAAINADTTVNKIVTATSALGVVTLTAKATGTTGNGIALTATGTGVTANHATLTGGAAATANSFTI